LKQFVNIKGVFFDLDGTLVDTAPELTHAINQLLIELGMKVLDSHIVKDFIGQGVDNLIKRSIMISSGEPINDYFYRAKELFNKFYGVNVGKSKPYPEVINILKFLKEKRLSLACITNKPKLFTDILLKESGVDQFLDQVVCGDTLDKKKPDPLPIQYGCKSLQLIPNEVIMVGDSCIDIDAGYAAGTYVVTVPYGYQYGQSIDTPKVDLAIKNFSDLKAVIN